VLSVLDRKWREHLYEMDYLREGVSLRSYGQRDPLIEYQREGYDMFTTMMDGIKEESVTSLFNLQVQVQENPIMEEAGQEGVAASAAPGLTAAPPSQQQPRHAAQPRQPAPPRHAGPPAQPAQPAESRQQAQPRQPARQAAAASQESANGDGAEALPAGLARGLARPKRAGQLSYSAPNEDASGQAQHTTTGADSAEYANVGRNAPCPCGSGKKFKQCHGDPRNR
jgi:preprotein translocase subunit SecA